MVSLVGFFTFFAVLFAFLGYRTKQRYRMQMLRNSIDGNYTVETEEKKRKTVRIPFFSALFTEFKKAGFRIGIKEFLLIYIISAIVGILLISFLISSGYGFMGILASFVMLRIWVRGRIKKRTLYMRGQFSNALIRMSNALKAQVPLHEAIRSVTDKIGDPLKTEFLRIYQNYQTERNMLKALKMVQEQIPLEEFELFVMSYEIHQEVGGDFPNLMEKLSQTIGEKQEMDRKLHTHSTQGRQNARIIGSLPIFIFIAMRLIAPELMQPLVDTSTGHFLLFYCFSSIALGWYMIRRLTDVTLD